MSAITPEQRIESELDALTRVILKGVSPGTWQPRHISYRDVGTVVDCLKSGMSRAQTVREAIRVRRRHVDNSGQVIEAQPEEHDLLPGDPSGLGGPVHLPHDERDLQHDRSDLKPRPQVVKGAADPHDANPVEAEHVMNQMRKNYPEKALKWMAKARWIGPIEVPQDRIDYDDVDSWAASHQGARVKEFAKKIKKGVGHTQPVVAVQEPGENRVKIIDGHHRTLAYQKLGKPIRAYVGFVDSDGGPWDETHVYQDNQGASPANKAEGHGGDTETLRRYWTHGKGAAKIRWGEPGDFERCVHHVGKYMADPEGYCQLRHHDALGIYTATHAKELSGKAAVPGLTKRSGMVSIDLPEGLVEPVPGGVEDHHLTLAYLGSDVDSDLIDDVVRAMKHVAAKTQPFTVTASGVDTFPASDSSDGKIPVFMPVTLSPELAALREPLAQYHASEHQDFHPHVTLAYQDEGENLPEPVPQVQIPVNHLTLHVGGEIVASIPLGVKNFTTKMSLFKVGPHGYIHGWLKIGGVSPKDVTARVNSDKSSIHFTHTTTGEYLGTAQRHGFDKYTVSHVHEPSKSLGVVKNPKDATKLIATRHNELTTSMPHGDLSPTPGADERDALQSYTGSGFHRVNAKLRDSRLSSEERPSEGDEASALHDVLTRNQLSEPLTVHRAIRRSSTFFGDVGSHVNRTYVDHGFTSTSTSEQVARERFLSKQDPALLHIKLPVGLNAMPVSRYRSAHGGSASEEEILLQHGTSFQVTDDYNDAAGLRHIHLNALQGGVS